MASWEDKFVRILESDDWVIDYDKEKKKYRVSYFEGFHFVDEIWFDCYEEREPFIIDFGYLSDFNKFSPDGSQNWNYRCVG